MGFWNLLVLTVSGALIGITLRNLLGRGSPIGLRSGWAAMVGFAGLAAWCFWKSREFRGNPATAGAMMAMQRFMMLYLIGLLLSAAGVTRQRKLLGKPPAPPVS
jgi:hypothetical protein